MAEREITIGGRRLSQLRVDELKVELEKRGLKKSGNKGVLIERLQEAIDKELEMKESFESYPVPQQTPAPVAEPWQHRMVQQQKQPGGFPVQPMGIPQRMLSQPQGLLNQPHVMMNQQQMMMHQQQQITSPVQVNEFREQWPQAQVPQPQMLYQQPQEQQQVVNQIPPVPDTKLVTQASNHKVLQPAVEPEVESSSSSDNEQDSAQQSSSSSSQESDDQEPQRPTSLLNYNYPTESKIETNASSAPVEEIKSNTVEDGEERSKEATPLQVQEEKMEEEEVRGPEKRPELEHNTRRGGGIEEEKRLLEEREMEVGEEKKEKEVVDEGKNERLNERPQGHKEGETPDKSPEKKAVISPQPEHEASPAEENTFEVEPSEEDKAVVEEPKAPSPPKPASPVVTKKRKINLPRTSLPTTPTSEGQPASRKRRWGSSSSSKKTSLSISTDSLKDLIPGVQVHSTPALEAVMDIGGDDNDEEEEEPEEKRKTEQKIEEEKEELPMATTPEVKEEGKKRKDRIVKVEEKKTIKLQRKAVVMETEPEAPKMEVEQEPSEHKEEGNPHPRRTSLPVQEAASPVAADHTPPPARNPRSETLHVRNLVRPFTQNQLKDLLSKHGTLVERGFWIDKIKSHCYAVYSDVEEAVASRQALHGIKWPATSPKVLDVDYADEDEMTRDTDGLLGKKKEQEREVKSEKVVTKDRPAAEENTIEVEEEEEDDQKNAGNLLDNLFRKTKTTPCLYWLPLTDEQIVTREREREERRKARQEERDKEEQERKERQEQREKERELEREKEKREREAEKQRSRSPRNRRRERSKSRSRSRGPRRR